MTPSHPADASPPLAVITGATQGIGRATAAGLLRAGFRVVLVLRAPDRWAAVSPGLAADVPGSEARLEGVVADLANGPALEAAAAEILARHPRIHLLVNNAGVADRRFHPTPEGIERTLAVNHLATVRLTHHLLPGLLAAGPAGGARIVHLSSEAHARRLDLTAFEGPKGYAGIHAYRQSKLLNLVHAFDLARRLAGTGVTVNAVHPGLVGTGLLYDFLPAGILRTLFRPLLSAVSRTPEEGARTSLHVATSPELVGRTGRYFVKEAEAEPASVARDREVQDGVRRWTEGLIGLDWRRFPVPEEG